MAESRALWYGRWQEGLETGLAAFRSTEFPDGAIVELDSLPPGLLDRADERWRALWHPRKERLLSVTFTRDGPRPWFVFVPGPSLALVAFDGPAVPPDQVIDRHQYARMGIVSSDQIGTVVWCPDSSQIHGVQVSEQHRREGVARVLLRAAGAHQICAGRRPAWGGGARTDLGELVAQGLPYAHRIDPRTRAVPDPLPDVLAEGWQEGRPDPAGTSR